MTRLLESERLRIFRFEIDNAQHEEGLLYVAFSKGVDRNFTPIATCVVSTNNHVEWLETSNEFRRQGFAKELREAVEGDAIAHGHGKLISDPATDSGRAFMQAIGRWSEDDAEVDIGSLKQAVRDVMQSFVDRGRDPDSVSWLEKIHATIERSLELTGAQLFPYKDGIVVDCWESVEREQSE